MHVITRRCVVALVCALTAMLVAVAKLRQWAIVRRTPPAPRASISSRVAPVMRACAPWPFSQITSTSVQAIPRRQVVPRLRNTASFAAQIAVKCSVVCDRPLQKSSSRSV